MKPLAEPMSGEDCRAEPLTQAHRDLLREACAEDPDIWQIYYVSYAPDQFDQSFEELLQRSWLPFALYDREAFAGMSCYLNLDDSRQTLEIGSTYYRPSHRGTGFNRRCKDMMMRHAFDRGYRRIEFRIDSRNARSQAAMKKLGAVREGVMRGDRVTWNGHVRDTVLFAILMDEYEP
ncbi:GNAT family protein [Sphingomonas sp.]|uniref:GNAT family N-acetyltransferase n=1 Tax=Sphingomonas sp. TaxID=28214 RepID=UPI00181BE00B|nr:GNAT family protein [Sphingomonas sp.]MBA3512635.1 GNAT family N-acetyltransferase [Sphingomonas sp.]